MDKMPNKFFRFAALVIVLFFLSLIPASAEPRYGGTLRWRMDSLPQTLDPASATFMTSMRTLSLCGEALVGLQKDGRSIAPLLAESWETNRNSTVWTFQLRQGVTFQKTGAKGKPTANGGRELVAADVKYSLERLVRKHSPRIYFLNQVRGFQEFWDGRTKEWEGIEVLNDHTVRFTLSIPYAPFLAALSYVSFCIVPHEDAEDDSFQLFPVGTGPFIVRDWQEDRIVLERNPDYWIHDTNGRTLPYLDGVELISIPESPDAVTAFQNASIDVLPDVPSTLRSTFEGKEGYQSRASLLTCY